MKTSKVTRATFNRTYASPNGDIYYFDIEFENGDKGSYGSKSNPPTNFAVGQDANYDLEPTKEYKGEMQYKVKPANSFGGGGFKGSKPYVKEDADEKLASMAYSYTKDLINGGKVDVKHINEIAEKIAFGIQNLASKLKAAKPKEVEAPQATSDPRAQYSSPPPSNPPQGNTYDSAYNDDLPF